MVPVLSFVFMAISAVIAIGLPILLVIWVMKKFKPGFWAVLSGMIVFFVLQIVFRLTLIQLFGLTKFGQAFIANNMLLYLAILSLSAGLVEEFGRFFAFKVMLKKKHEFRHGIAYGIGHGGIEAIILVGLAFVSNIVVAVLINNGVLASLPGIGAEAIQPTIDVMVNTPSIQFLLGGFERVFAICLHIALSIMVLHGVRKRQIGFTLLAILIHGAVNFIAVCLAQYVNIYLSEAFLLIVALACVLYVILMYKLFIKQDSESLLSEIETKKTTK
jgi:uncharacterized membrane protein YhfC